jgi:hypothetical protein
VKDNNPNAHNRIFKKVIKTNKETMEVNIINLFTFTLKDNILKWGKIFVQDHPNCTFKELEQAFCKCFWIVKNDEIFYKQLRNLQQLGEWVEVYYDHLLKLADCLQVKVIDVLFITIFKVNL